MKKILSYLLVVLMLPIGFILTGCFGPKDSLSLDLSLVKRVYRVGENYSSVDLVVKYNDGEKTKVVTKYTIDSSDYKKDSVGTYIIKVKYQDVSATYKVNVIDYSALLTQAIANKSKIKGIYSTQGDGYYVCSTEDINYHCYIEDNYIEDRWINKHENMKKRYTYNDGKPTEFKELVGSDNNFYEHNESIDTLFENFVSTEGVEYTEVDGYAAYVKVETSEGEDSDNPSLTITHRYVTTVIVDIEAKMIKEINYVYYKNGVLAGTNNKYQFYTSKTEVLKLIPALPENVTWVLVDQYTEEPIAD